MDTTVRDWWNGLQILTGLKSRLSYGHYCTRLVVWVRHTHGLCEWGAWQIVNVLTHKHNYNHNARISPRVAKVE